MVQFHQGPVGTLFNAKQPNIGFFFYQVYWNFRDCFGDSALLIEMLHESLLIDKFLFDTHGGSSNKIKSSHWENFKSKVSRFNSKNLNELVNRHQAQLIFLLNSCFHDHFRVNHIQFHSLFLEHSLHLWVLFPIKRIQQRDSRSRTDPLNRYSIYFPFGPQILHIVRGLNELLCKLQQFEVLWRSRREVSVASFTAKHFVEGTKLALGQECLSHASPRPQNALDSSGNLFGRVELDDVLFLQTENAVSGGCEIVDDFEILHVELFF
mmetsp:Transcript_38498/g.28339  ORF Transcript_38498/g.28339 Transcript_38498/m.28339 type:complete len:266 (+) Transcript_38498:59-856(+)